MAVYFAQLPTGAIKIGYSANVEHRIRNLRSHYGTELALLRTMDGGRKTEREMHERFAHLRFKGTEQFRAGADLMEFIGLPILVNMNAEVVESRPLKLGTSKVDSTVLRKAKTVADRLGLPVSTYLSRVVGAAVERDLDKIYKRLLKEEKNEEGGDA